MSSSSERRVITAARWIAWSRVDGCAGVLPTNNRIVRKWHHNRENNEVVEFSVLHEDIRNSCFAEIRMPHAIQIRQTGGPEVLNWTAVDVGEPVVFDSVGKDTFLRSLDCLRHAD